MAIPNPELFSEWQSWAKSVSRWSEEASGLAQEDFGNYTQIADFYQDWLPLSGNKLSYRKMKNSMVHIAGAVYSSSSVNLGVIFKVPDGVAPKTGIYGQNLYPVIKNTYGGALTHETLLFTIPGRNFGQMFTVSTLSLIYIDILYQTSE